MGRVTSCACSSVGLTAMFSLENKTALITGAGSGIGASIAETFARQGAHVFVTDRDAVTGTRVVGQIIAANNRAEFLHLDVTDAMECEQVARFIHERTGHLDILVNNAGIGHVGTISTTTADDVDRLYAVN